MARSASLPAEDPTRAGVGRLLAPFVPGVIAIGVIATLVASIYLWDREESNAEQALLQRQQVVVDSVDRALSEATLRLVSIAGLYQASDGVTDTEFMRFGKNVGLSHGMVAMGYIRQVVDRNLEGYQRQMQQESPEFTVYELDSEGRQLPPGEKRVHNPLERVYPEVPGTRVVGFDTSSDPLRAATLERARLTRLPAITPFISLVGDDDDDGFLLIVPVTDPDSGALTGHANAALDLSELVDSAVLPLMDQIVSWEVTDRTADEPISGPSLLEVGGRVWQIDITPDPRSSMVPDPTYPLLLFGLGLVATAVAAAGLNVKIRQKQAEADFEHLRELTRAKDQFLASVGHELRTPLTSVLGFAELLRADGSELSDAERRAMIASVADEATDLAAIVDDLLVAARSELDLLVVQRVPVSAQAQVAQVLEMTRRPGESQQVEVIAERDDGYRAAGDPGRVRQILRNLVTNAGRYGGDRVVIRLSDREDTVHIEVRDNGPGVASEDAERIFDAYYRAHSAGSQPAALGIGLAVARQLARLMGGDLVYYRDDGWTVFELILPRVDAVPMPEEAALRAAAITG